MKHRVIAVALTVLASPAFALDVAPPFEQVQLDRQLAELRFAPVEPYVADNRAPYEQLAVDRALPNLPRRNTQLAEAAAGGAGNTRLDAGSDIEAPAGSPWANDFHFIAPPQ